MSDRSDRISKLLGSHKSRTSYIKAKLGILVPAQIRALRLKSTNPEMPYQRDLARQAEMHQSRISMFETPGMSNMTLETLAKVAAALKVGVIVKFVPFSEMLRWENGFSPDSFDVVPRLEQDVNFLEPARAAQRLTNMVTTANQMGGEDINPSTVNLVSQGSTRPAISAAASISRQTAALGGTR